MPREFDLRRFLLDHIHVHWSYGEDLCKKCEGWWLKQSPAFRKEAKHNYEFDKD